MVELRRPLFASALALAALVVVVELGAVAALGGDRAGPSVDDLVARGPGDPAVEVTGGVEEPTGRALPLLALLDGIVLYTVALVGIALVAPARLQGRVQGVVTLVLAAVLVVAALVLAAAALGELAVMLGLLGSFFGVPVYVAVWGAFPRGDAAVLLSLAMALKVALAVLLVLAHPRFLQNRGLVALVATSLVATVAVSVLHALVPLVLVSVTDRIAAVVVAAVVVVWGIVLVVGSVPAVARALRADRALVR